MGTNEISRISMLPELFKNGVDELIIDARLKNPLFIAVTLRSYQKAWEILTHRKSSFKSEIKPLENDLRAVTARGFTLGFAESIRKNKNSEKIENSYDLFNFLKNLQRGGFGRLPSRFSLSYIEDSKTKTLKEDLTEITIASKEKDKKQNHITSFSPDALSSKEKEILEKAHEKLNENQIVIPGELLLKLFSISQLKLLASGHLLLNLSEIKELARERVSEDFWERAKNLEKRGVFTETEDPFAKLKMLDALSLYGKETENLWVGFVVLYHKEKGVARIKLLRDLVEGELLKVLDRGSTFIFKLTQMMDTRGNFISRASAEKNPFIHIPLPHSTGKMAMIIRKSSRGESLF